MHSHHAAPFALLNDPVRKAVDARATTKQPFHSLVSMILFVLAIASPVAAQRVGDYDIVIVPTFFFGPGAHGSQWETQVSVTGLEAGEIVTPILRDLDSTACFPGDVGIAKEETREICPVHASPSGRILYIERALGERNVLISTRIRDLTRQASSAGTEIPVVRERDFRTEVFYLVRIPSDPRFRANLRLFGGMQTWTPADRFINPGSTIRVEICDSRDLSAPLAITDVQLGPPETVQGYALTPAFASIPDLVAAFPQLAGVPEYTLRLQPLQSLADPPHESSVWGFVTITNNDTQEVTITTP